MPQDTPARLATIPLTLLATSDVHAHLLSYDYFSDRPAEKPALTRIATLIAEIRRTHPNVLLLDNGDFLQGTALSDLFCEDGLPTDMPHPVIAAMNHLGYDVAGLGNHEFNLDLPDLAGALQQAAFPCLNANLHPTATGTALNGLWHDRLILRRTLQGTDGTSHSLKIGLFSVLPPQVLAWDHTRIGTRLTAADMVTAARAATTALRAEGADIVIALAHTGFGPDTHEDGMENAAHPILALPDIDAIVFGHTHLPYSTSRATPAVLPAAEASQLGRIDLTLTRTAATWQVTETVATLLPATPQTHAEDQDLRALLEPAHQRTLKGIRRPVGTLPRAVHSYFCVLPDCNPACLIAEAQRHYVARQLKDTPLAALPLLSASAPQKNGGRSGPDHFTDVPAGPIALSHVTDIQYFPNEISVMRLTGAEIADWLEMSASMYRQITPHGGDQPLLDPAFPAYNSDTIFGLTYEIDLTQPPRYATDGTLLNSDSRRIRALRHDGAPISPSADFLVAMNNYRSGGGGYFPHVSPDRIVFERDTKVRDILADYIATLDGDPSIAFPWRFTPIPGAFGLFETGPAARRLLKNSNLQDLGLTDQGFLRLRTPI